jgi:hypothetical protein
MRALETEVVNALFEADEPLLSPSDDSHPLGCHRPRVPVSRIRKSGSGLT